MDRRSSPRVRRRAQCTIEQGKMSLEGTLLDVSEGGLSLACSDPLEQGSLVHIAFAALGKKIKATAVVWHSRPIRYMGAPGFLFGMMLDEASPEYQLLLPKRSVAGGRSAGIGEIPTLEEAEAMIEKQSGSSSSSASKARPEAAPGTRASETEAATDEPESPPSETARAEFADSLKEGRKDTPGQSFRVRAKKRSQPRTKTLSLTADSERDAREAATQALGADWEVLEVTRAA